MRAPRLGLAALIAFGVSVASFLPPVIHYISGPFGPFIGGFVAGYWLRLDEVDAAFVGLMMGIAIGGALVLSFEYFDFLPDLALQASVPLSGIAALYVGALGALGVWVGGSRRAAD
jgi:hypothetical protein